MRHLRHLVLTGCAMASTTAWSSPYIEHLYDCHALLSVFSISQQGQLTEDFVLGQDSLWRIGSFAIFGRMGFYPESQSLIEFSQSRFDNLASIHNSIVNDPELTTALSINLANDLGQCFSWSKRLTTWLVAHESEAIAAIEEEDKNYFVNAQFNDWLAPDTLTFEAENETSKLLRETFSQWRTAGYPGPMSLVAPAVRLVVASINI